MREDNRFTEQDIEVYDDGISVKNTFFNKKRIADTFNELIIANDFIKNHK